MRRYELMLLLRPDLEDDKLQAAVEKVTRAVVNGGGSLTKVSPWGKRRLAYDIQRHREASYFLIHFDIEPSAVREIERGMLISEEILRHLVTVLEDRGPAEELAPAAAAREQDPGATSTPSDGPSEAPDPSTPTSPAADGAVTATASPADGSPAPAGTDAPDAAPADAAPADEAPADAATADDVATETAEEDRAEG
ncbi:MAG: 30S ribosomal protein S6 [Candidatus Limnocylindria bacterium]